MIDNVVIADDGESGMCRCLQRTQITEEDEWVHARSGSPDCDIRVAELPLAVLDMLDAITKGEQ